MDPQRVLTSAQDTMAARRVFGDPIVTNSATILPVAVISGGGGGGSGEKGEAGGAGVGFGLKVRAAGVFVIRDGTASWRPAIDVNRIVLGGQLVAVTALLVLGPVLDRWLHKKSAHQSAELLSDAHLAHVPRARLGSRAGAPHIRREQRAMASALET